MFQFKTQCDGKGKNVIVRYGVAAMGAEPPVSLGTQLEEGVGLHTTLHHRQVLDLGAHFPASSCWLRLAFFVFPFLFVKSKCIFARELHILIKLLQTLFRSKWAINKTPSEYLQMSFRKDIEDTSTTLEHSFLALNQWCIQISAWIAFISLLFFLRVPLILQFSKWGVCACVWNILKMFLVSR